MEYTFCHFIIIFVKYNKWPNNLNWFKILMPHSISLAASMNLEHSIKEGSHERYPVHLKCLRNIKKIKYPDFQAMTVVSSKQLTSKTWCCSASCKYLSRPFDTSSQSDCTSLFEVTAPELSDDKVGYNEP